MDFKKSIQEESSIIAVAIAITALSLDNLSRTHWTARAFFILSLLTSIIAVYYATKQYRILGHCSRAEHVKAWIQNLDKDSPTSIYEKLPSVASVLTVSAPNMLLSFSLNSFLAGLGIYLGFTWIRSLDETAGVNGSRAVFITYIVGLCISYGIYALSSMVVSNQTYVSDEELLRAVNGLPPGDRDGSNHEETGGGFGDLPTPASANRSDNISLDLHTPQMPPETEPRHYTSSNDVSTRRELLEVFQEAARLRAASGKVDERLAGLLEKIVEDDMV
ncbi:uncharacterized protein J4E79_001840 [Alternaria viburni]|uniref:uncharacterized protein n=1 Tax=Alternaria viburni TaxID=566460 RepID=UPI0020C50911|nr:uncharacterized protein J4E79_001840 [Alternaria viburni]KAI4667156.1 hypothetical protein J4E79_001840 [Alternaria viburni]